MGHTHDFVLTIPWGSGSLKNASHYYYFFLYQFLRSFWRQAIPLLPDEDVSYLSHIAFWK